MGRRGQGPGVVGCGEDVGGLLGSGEGTGAVLCSAQAGTCHSFEYTSDPPRRGFSPVLHKILAISPPFPFLLGLTVPIFTPLHTHFWTQREAQEEAGLGSAVPSHWG